MCKLRIALFVLFVSAFSTVSSVQARHLPPPITPSRELVGLPLPERIGGYKVLAVLTSDNTACMMPGEKRLILQADHSNVHDYLKNSHPEAIKKDLKQSGLGEMSKWGFQIAGPGANLDRALLELQSWNEQAREFGCRKVRPVGDRTVSKKIMLASMLTIGTDGTEIKKPSPFFGYAEFEDTDAGTFTDDNAQSVFLIAPASIGNRRDVVAFLNNVATDASPLYVLQNGLYFLSGNGRVIWSDTTQAYRAQTYVLIPYVASHTYWLTLTFTSGVWQLCAYDTADPSNYTCIQEFSGTGTTLGANLNTAVWVENQNTATHWYNGFSSPFTAYGAQIYRNGTGQNWLSQHRHTVDACTAVDFPPANALSGSLTGGGSGNFILSGVPTTC